MTEDERRELFLKRNVGFTAWLAENTPNLEERWEELERNSVSFHIPVNISDEELEVYLKDKPKCIVELFSKENVVTERKRGKRGKKRLRK